MREVNSFIKGLVEADARQKKINEAEEQKVLLFEQKKRAARESLRVANEWYSQRIIEPAAEVYAEFRKRNISPVNLTIIHGEEGLFFKKPDTHTYGWLINRTSNPQEHKYFHSEPPAGGMIFLLSDGNLQTLQYKFTEYYGHSSWYPTILQ